jgi:hypothetical protein
MSEWFACPSFGRPEDFVAHSLYSSTECSTFFRCHCVKETKCSHLANVQWHVTLRVNSRIFVSTAKRRIALKIRNFYFSNTFPLQDRPASSISPST